jgi:hypothetical protein
MTTFTHRMLIGRRHLPFARLLHRLAAAGSIALVLLLTVLAASPAAHEWIHGHTEATAQAAGSDDDGCVVTLFGQGLFGAAVFAALLIAFLCLFVGTPTPHEGLGRSVPRYWLPPLCGPPRG